MSEITTVSQNPGNAVQQSNAVSSFELAQRQATALSKSTLVPEQYRGNTANCLIALEVANRTGASPLMVMQNLYVVHGRPSWSSQYIIAAINSCGRFNNLRYEIFGEGDGMTCIAWTAEKGVTLSVHTLKAAREAKLPILESPPVSIKMAREEEWLTKKGSKWKTMPELMLRYRAAAFFGRLYAPEILMGMHSREEIEDSQLIDVTPQAPVSPESADPFQKAAAGISENTGQQEATMIDASVQMLCDGMASLTTPDELTGYMDQNKPLIELALSTPDSPAATAWLRALKEATERVSGE